ncbi:MAG: cyclic nucleotide-binding domain-containing protein [Deltaproteobacteria bacterium]|nr:cyclic nucleotide-binding domain-containing protein [Deltaproteobacteria bacterium]
MALLDWVKKAATKKPSMTVAPQQPQGSPQAAAPGSEVTDRYEHRGEVGRGGMGAILKVVDRGLRRTLAMKILEPADGVTDDTRAALFVEEAQITSQLDHPNICPIHEYGRDATGVHFFTMKLVRGKTLADIVHAPGYDASDPRSVRDALDVLRRVCDALAFAHSKGVLHRDLKPENIMVGDFGQVYLMDWGIALLLPNTTATDMQDAVTVSRQGASPTTAAGTIVGTLMYMPPEQARGEAVDVRTDVFGLGAILYEILTQVPPYYSPNIGDLVLMAQGAGWRSPQEMAGTQVPLPSALCAICERAMHINPAQRYQTVSDFKAALDEFLVGGLSFPTITVQPGHCIVNEGESGDRAYIIQRGYCRVYKHIAGEQVALTDLGPGDVFGETAVFAQTPRTATIQALTDVTLQVVSGEVFEKDLGMASAMGAFVKAVAQRFVSTDQQLRTLQHEVTQAALARERMSAEAAAQAAQTATQTAMQTTATTTPTPSQQLAPMSMPMPMPPLPIEVMPGDTADMSTRQPSRTLRGAPAGLNASMNPFALIDAVVRLQALAEMPSETGALLIEALSRGTQILAEERAKKIG